MTSIELKDVAKGKDVTVGNWVGTLTGEYKVDANGKLSKVEVQWPKPDNRREWFEKERVMVPNPNARSSRSSMTSAARVDHGGNAEPATTTTSNSNSNSNSNNKKKMPSHTTSSSHEIQSKTSKNMPDSCIANNSPSSSSPCSTSTTTSTSSLLLTQAPFWSSSLQPPVGRGALRGHGEDNDKNDDKDEIGGDLVGAASLKSPPPKTVTVAAKDQTVTSPLYIQSPDNSNSTSGYQRALATAQSGLDHKIKQKDAEIANLETMVKDLEVTATEYRTKQDAALLNLENKVKLLATLVSTTLEQEVKSAKDNYLALEGINATLMLNVDAKKVELRHAHKELETANLEKANLVISHKSELDAKNVELRHAHKELKSHKDDIKKLDAKVVTLHDANTSLTTELEQLRRQNHVNLESMMTMCRQSMIENNGGR